MTASSGVKAQGGASVQVVADKLCRACKLPMPAAANKCTKCSSIQNWRRYLDFSGFILSLLVALTSVPAFAIPIWKETLTPKVMKPTATLLEVDDTGLATIAIANGGTAPALLEHLLFGSKEAVVRFDLGPTASDKKVIEPNELSVLTVRLSVKNDVDDVWNLVQIYRSKSGCGLEAGLVSPDGVRAKTIVNASTAGLNKSKDGVDGCSLKLQKLSVMTLTYFGDKPAFVATFCKVAELHPRDPKRPEVGTNCKK